MTEQTDAAPQDPAPERPANLNQERLVEYSSMTPENDRSQHGFRAWWEETYPDDFDQYIEPGA